MLTPHIGHRDDSRTTITCFPTPRSTEVPGWMVGVNPCAGYQHFQTMVQRLVTGLCWIIKPILCLLLLAEDLAVP